MKGPIGELLETPDFLRLWLVGAFANAMRWLELLISGVFAYEATGSALAVTGVVAARQLPQLAFGAFAGAVSEAVNRKLIVMLAILLPTMACAFIFLGVRLSLASPLTFATGRITIRGSWTMTRHRFWPLFGTYLIAFALSLVVSALTLAIAVLAVAILGGGLQALGPAFQSDTSTVSAILTPARLVYLAISAIGAALTSPITMCPPAAIYQALSGGTPASDTRKSANASAAPGLRRPMPERSS